MVLEKQAKQILGWREWLALPSLGIPAIKAKVDTGAKTSALHAFAVESFLEEGVDKVRFQIHPLQRRTDIVQTCVAPIADQRMVSDSGGHREMRYVISTTIVLGTVTTEAEFTLTDRDSMQFRMLLGRSTMAGIFIVDPAASYLVGKKPRTKLLKFPVNFHSSNP
ncbi:MAG: RimK/LysX family protein [Desulfocapsa sp.]|nr:RimK/LysX family protein [Desulfocapsa sp.]